MLSRQPAALGWYEVAVGAVWAVRLSNSVIDDSKSGMVYEYENHEVQNCIDRAAADKKVDLLRAMSFGTWTDLIPGVMDRLASLLSFAGKRGLFVFLTTGK